jgi:hypothetical protein
MAQKKLNDRRYQRFLGCLAVFTGLCGIFAIANPDIFSYLPCFTNCEARAANELLNKDKPISTLIDVKKLDKKAIAIVVEKSKYKLTVLYQKNLLNPMRSFLGKTLRMTSYAKVINVRQKEYFASKTFTIIQNGQSLFGWTTPIQILGASSHRLRRVVK